MRCNSKKLMRQRAHTHVLSIHKYLLVFLSLFVCSSSFFVSTALFIPIWLLKRQCRCQMGRTVPPKNTIHSDLIVFVFLLLWLPYFCTFHRNVCLFNIWNEEQMHWRRNTTVKSGCVFWISRCGMSSGVFDMHFYMIQWRLLEEHYLLLSLYNFGRWSGKGLAIGY